LNFEVLCKRDVRSQDREETETLERQDRDFGVTVSRRDRDVRDRDYNPGDYSGQYVPGIES